jgi:hypothetical protein
MQKIRCMAEVQIVNEITELVENKQVEIFLKETDYEKASKEDRIEDIIVDCVKSAINIYEYEFINRLRKYTIY